MNISKQNIDDVTAVLKLEVAKEDYEKRVEEVLRDYRRKAQMPGFRKGKVPASVVMKMYGKAVLVDEINKIVSEELTNYLRESELNILGEPLPSEQQQTIDFDAQDSFEFAFDIAYAPEMELKLSKREKLKYYNLAIDEKMVDTHVESYTRRFGSQDQVEVAEEKDLLRVDLVEVDGEGAVVEGGITVEGAVMSVEHMKDADEKAKFVGATKEQVIVFNPKKAYENTAELASLLRIEKEAAEALVADFQATVSEVTRFSAAEVNQELFDKVYGENAVATEEEFRNRIIDELKDLHKNDSEYRFLVDAREKLMKKVEDVVLPEGFLKRWLKATNEELTEEQIEQDFGKFVEDLRWTLVKQKLAKDNELKVEEADTIEFAKKMAQMQFAQYGMSNVPAETLDGYAREMIKNPEQGRHIIERALENKVLGFVKTAVKIEEVEISQEEFNKLFE